MEPKANVAEEPERNAALDEIIEQLAARLFLVLENLDPSLDMEGVKWEGLRDRDRELYRQAIIELLEEESLLRAALAQATANR